MEKFTPEEQQQYLVETQGFTPSEAAEFVAEQNIPALGKGVQADNPLSYLQAFDIAGSPTREAIVRISNALSKAAGKKEMFPNLQKESALNGSAVGSYPGFADILERSGNPNIGSVDVPIPGADRDVTITGRDILGTAGDIVSDPLTWTGIGALATGPTKLAARLGAILEKQGVKGYGRVFDSLMKEAGKKSPEASVKMIPKALLEAGAKGSWENIYSKIFEGIDNLESQISKAGENVTEKFSPKGLRESLRPVTSDVLQNTLEQGDYAAADKYFDQINDFKRPGFDADMTKWQKKAREYIQQKRQFEKLGGKIGQDVLTPEMQFSKSVLSPESVELVGKDATKLKPESFNFDQMDLGVEKRVTEQPLEYILNAENPDIYKSKQRVADIKMPTQMKLYYPDVLPENYRPGAPEITDPGINLRNAEQMKIELTKNYPPDVVSFILSMPESDIYKATQRKISGTELVPKSYGSADVPKNINLIGQGEFPIMPTAPAKVLNQMGVQDLLNYKRAMSKEAKFDTLGAKSPTYRGKAAEGSGILRQRAIDAFEKEGFDLGDTWRQESALLSAAPIAERRMISASKKPLMSPFEMALLLNEYTVGPVLAKKAIEGITSVPFKTNMYETMYRAGKAGKNLPDLKIPQYLKRNPNLMQIPAQLSKENEELP